MTDKTPPPDGDDEFGTVDEEMLQLVEDMHRTLHADLVPSIVACPAVDHTWSAMLERFRKLEGTPVLDGPEPMHNQRSQLAGFTFNLDGTLKVDGSCPNCGQGTLSLGAALPPRQRSGPAGRSTAVMCTNLSCSDPTLVSRLLASRNGQSIRKALQLAATAGDVPKRLQDVELPEPGPILVERDADGKCTSCGSMPDAYHTLTCRWKAADDGWRNVPVAPADAMTPEDAAAAAALPRTTEESLENIAAREADADRDGAAPHYSPVAKSQRPVGPDPADRPVYTCHVDRCGGTPERPCDPAFETLDKVHEGDTAVVTYEVPD